MRFTAHEYRSAKVRHHASIIEARPGFSRGAEKIDPDEYRQQHGKCPRGFQFDRKEDKCVPKGGAPADQPEEAPDQDLDQPEEAPPKKRKKPAPKKQEEQEKREAKKGAQKMMRDLRRKDLPIAEKNKLLTKLSETNWGAYRKEVDRMRESGELPDEETAELMVKIKGFDDLPDDVKNDKEKLRGFLTQQNAERDHKKRELAEQIKYIQTLDDANEMAIERGEEPKKLNMVEMMTEIESKLGRQLAATPEQVAEFAKGNEEVMLQGLLGAAPKPGSPGSRFKKFFDKLIQPLPNLSPLWDRIGGVRSSFGQVSDRLDGLYGSVSSTGDNMSMRKVRAALDYVAEELESRGALKLSRLVDAEASGLPEADKLPDGEKAKKWDEDWTQKTADYREDLGYPPYDRVRPGVKGDDAED